MSSLLKLILTISFISYAAPRGVNVPIDSPTPGQLSLVNVFPELNFIRPVFLTHAGDGSDWLYVVEQDGQIFRLKDEPQAKKELFLDIRPQVERGGNEQGLLGLAFDPKYRENGSFYVFYSARGPRRSILSRFTARAGKVIAESEKKLLEIPLPPEVTNHDGGMIAFGPDGYLYIGVGDGGAGGDPWNHAQNKNVLLGKILRVDVKGEIAKAPSDNPFVGEAGTRPEIWAWGLRNPWRFSFDREGGKLWAGDVGQNAVEEIDIIEKGGNYGWRIFEGNREFNNPSHLPAANFKAPVWSYPQSAGGKSVTGGYVYRGPGIASLRGAYVYGDFVSGNIWTLRLGANGPENRKVASVPVVSSFGENRDGELYALSFEGKIYRFKEDQATPSPTFPQKLSQTGLFTNLNTLEVIPEARPYSVNSALWSDGATKQRWLYLPEGGKVEFSESGNWRFPVGTILIKHFELSSEGRSPRRLETRLMVHERQGWAGYTYRWNAEQSDAHLINERQLESLGSQTWVYPSRTDCLSCHTAASGWVLGVRTAQLNRDQNGENLLDEWNRAGVFSQPIPEAAALSAYPSLYDASAAMDLRARAYLAVNCSSCHQPLGPTPTEMDLRFETALSETRLVNEKLSHILPTAADERRLVPGKKENSAVWNLIRHREGKFMPPLGSQVVDSEAVELIGKWVDSLRSH